jgi:hypothetical protein
MSDGPHKTLPRRPKWREVAEAADKAAFSINDIVPRVIEALAEEFRLEIADGVIETLKNLLGGDQGQLFVESQLAELRAIRGGLAASPLSVELVGNLEVALHEGHAGIEALTEAASNTLTERAFGTGRQMEEHYYRETGDEGRSVDVRTRVETAIETAAIRDLARGLVTGEPADTLPAKQRHDGLDDGPEK